jgi:hypothetical protein
VRQLGERVAQNLTLRVAETDELANRFPATLGEHALDLRLRRRALPGAATRPRTCERLRWRLWEDSALQRPPSAADGPRSGKQDLDRADPSADVSDLHLSAVLLAAVRTGERRPVLFGRTDGASSSAAWIPSREAAVALAS